jgi:hypothetical protein
MSPPVLHLPLDLSGNAVTNKVTAELHIVAATGTRAFVPTRGSFFTRGLILRNRITGTELIPDIHYRPVHLNIDASLRCGQEICSVILILPTSNVAEVELDYQAIGGEYSTSVSAIEQMLESLDLDNRTIRWGDIIGIPNYFAPAAHPHDIGDLYGFEYLVAILEQIRRAILLGDQAAFDELRQYVNLQDTALRNLITTIQTLMDEHIGNTNNPHNTNKSQIGLGLVDNFATADQQAAIEGSVNNLFMTPLRTAQAIASLVGNTLNAHIGNTNNPHNTTKTHVGLSNVVNYGLAKLDEAQAGVGEAYMTASLTGVAITALAINPLNVHIARTDNPHGTNKSHVGLALVDNYATATIQQAQDGVATDLFMTPATTRAQIDTIVGDSLSAHINDTNNPHNTDKSQVGLGSVVNLGLAKLQEAEAGVGEAYMTASLTGVAITALALAPLNAHIGNGNNPHNTNKSQIGLGSVLNYGLAGQNDAESGSSNALYMTPLRTKQAITLQAVTPLTTLINQRVVTGSDAQLSSLVLGTSGYFYQDEDGSISLRVAGNRYFQFSAGGNLIVNNGKVIASGGFQPSDKRFKKSIVTTEARPLWRTTDFKSWVNRDTGVSDRGVVAQDLIRTAPDRVTEFDYGKGKRKSKRLAVDYIGTGFEMAYAAGHEIDCLKTLVEQQGKLIEDLQSQMDLLRRKS